MMMKKVPLKKQKQTEKIENREKPEADKKGDEEKLEDTEAGPEIENGDLIKPEKVEMDSFDLYDVYKEVVEEGLFVSNEEEPPDEDLSTGKGINDADIIYTLITVKRQVDPSGSSLRGCSSYLTARGRLINMEAIADFSRLYKKKMEKNFQEDMTDLSAGYYSFGQIKPDNNLPLLRLMWAPLEPQLRVSVKEFTAETGIGLLLKKIDCFNKESGSNVEYYFDEKYNYVYEDSNRGLKNNGDESEELMDEKDTEVGSESEQGSEKSYSFIWMQKLIHNVVIEEFKSKTNEDFEDNLEVGRDNAVCLMLEKSSEVESDGCMEVVEEGIYVESKSKMVEVKESDISFDLELLVLGIDLGCKSDLDPDFVREEFEDLVMMTWCMKTWFIAKTRFMMMVKTWFIKTWVVTEFSTRPKMVMLLKTTEIEVCIAANNIKETMSKMSASGTGLEFLEIWFMQMLKNWIGYLLDAAIIIASNAPGSVPNNLANLGFWGRVWTIRLVLETWLRLLKTWFMRTWFIKTRFISTPKTWFMKTRFTKIWVMTTMKTWFRKAQQFFLHGL